MRRISIFIFFAIIFCLEISAQTGFVNLKIHKEKAVTVPDKILLSYLNEEELEQFKISGAGIFSITIGAEKPL